MLEKTNSSSLHTTFLDMDIKVKDKKFGTKLYDKRIDFSFNVISMPNLKSNIPLIQTYGVFYSQLFRLCYVNSCLEGFVSDVKLLGNN